MSSDKIIELAFYTLPALVTGATVYYVISDFLSNEDKKRKYQLIKENQKQALPLKLQAYERLALFLERINPTKLLIRVAPLSDSKLEYQNLLIQHTEQEYEHNLTQQIYVSDQCWTMIVTAKNSIIQNLRKAVLNSDVKDANQLREFILSNLFDSESATSIALDYLKSEVKEIL